MNPETLVFIGRSGSGKGTQARLLIEYLKEKDPNRSIYYLESGAAFRKLIEGESLTSKLSKKIYDAGGLQPEFLAIWVWSNLLMENLKGDEHLILDGTPRKSQEAGVLDSAFIFYRRGSPRIIYIDVSREWSVKRLTDRSRPDDNPGDIEARLDWFETDVLPAINFFRNNAYYQVHDINGEQEIEKVHEDVLTALGWQK